MKKRSIILPETTYEELVLINKELETRNDFLAEYYQTNQQIKLGLQQEIEEATLQLLQANAQLKSANKELIFQNNEKEKRADELGIANIELAFQNEEKEKRATELGIANIELAFQNEEKGKRASELEIANIELAFQNNEKEKRATELGIANIELAFQNEEKGKRAAELGIANIELAFQNKEKENRATELGIANIELAFQNEEKGKRADELGIANIELTFQNNEKEKRATELGIANIELAFQNEEKGKRADELEIANIELAFQNNEKEKRAIELVSANEDLISLAFISSHDLQEPLRKIHTFINQIIDEEVNLSDKSKSYFKKIDQTTKRMKNLLDDLLAYSRIKSGERIFEETDLNLLLEDVKKDFEDVIQQKNAVIKSNDLGSVKIIPFQFRELLHNLISNSLKFSNPDVATVITLKSEIVLADKVEQINTNTTKKYFYLKYTDNGIGFDNQYKDRIFEVFQRLHSSENFNGTGMGLAICKKIIENHSGVITVNGKVGKGVQFDIYLPV